MPFTPKEILARIPETKIKARLYAQIRIFDEIIEPRWPNVYLNRDILLHCIESYFCDLWRMKEFHAIGLADGHKRAAFTMKWIVRAKPVQIKQGKTISRADLLVNEVYAIISGLRHIDRDARKISNNFYRNMLYTLHYRNIDVELLSSLMYAIECGIDGKAP